MDRITRIGSHDPLTVVELVTAIFMVIGGLYVLAPLVLPVDLGLPGGLTNAPSAIQTLASTIGLALLGAVSLVIGSVHTWAIFRYRYRIRSAMVFSHILVRLYTVIATILIQGFFPLNWLNSLIIVCVLAVCYLTLRRKIGFLRELK